MKKESNIRKADASKIAHEAAMNATTELIRKVRRDPRPENIHDLIDAVEDERAAE